MVSRPAPRILAAHLILPQRESGRFLFVETNAGTQTLTDTTVCGSPVERLDLHLLTLW